MKRSVYHFFFYGVAKESEEHREKIERLHKRISNVDKNRNKTPSVSYSLLLKYRAVASP